MQVLYRFTCGLYVLNNIQHTIPIILYIVYYRYVQLPTCYSVNILLAIANIILLQPPSRLVRRQIPYTICSHDFHLLFHINIISPVTPCACGLRATGVMNAYSRMGSGITCDRAILIQNLPGIETFDTYRIRNTS